MHDEWNLWFSFSFNKWWLYYKQNWSALTPWVQLPCKKPACGNTTIAHTHCSIKAFPTSTWVLIFYTNPGCKYQICMSSTVTCCLYIAPWNPRISWPGTHLFPLLFFCFCLLLECNAAYTGFLSDPCSEIPPMAPNPFWA